MDILVRNASPRFSFRNTCSLESWKLSGTRSAYKAANNYYQVANELGLAS